MLCLDRVISSKGGNISAILHNNRIQIQGTTIYSTNGTNGTNQTICWTYSQPESNTATPAINSQLVSNNLTIQKPHSYLDNPHELTTDQVELFHLNNSVSRNPKSGGGELRHVWFKASSGGCVLGKLTPTQKGTNGGTGVTLKQALGLGMWYISNLEKT